MGNGKGRGKGGGLIEVVCLEQRGGEQPVQQPRGQVLLELVLNLALPLAAHVRLWTIGSGLPRCRSVYSEQNRQKQSRHLCFEV